MRIALVAFGQDLPIEVIDRTKDQRLIGNLDGDMQIFYRELYITYFADLFLIA